MATRDQIEEASRPPTRDVGGFVHHAAGSDHLLYRPSAPETEADERRRAAAFVRAHAPDPASVLAALGLEAS